MSVESQRQDASWERTSPRSRVIAALATAGTVRFPREPNDVPRTERPELLAYAVFNGEAVLHVGKGDRVRMRKCMRGGLAGKHDKAFVCALGEIALGAPNDYACVVSDRAAEVESAAHAALGGSARVATRIEGVAADTLLGVHTWLWERTKQTPSYAALDPVERAMAEELFEVVAYATTRVSVASHDGDNLEGHILAAIDRAYLIPVFEKLTSGYLRYRKHRPGAAAFEARKRGYTYEPRRAPFELSASSSA